MQRHADGAETHRAQPRAVERVRARIEIARPSITSGSDEASFAIASSAISEVIGLPSRA
jgi:hypothetical protein